MEHDWLAISCHSDHHFFPDYVHDRPKFLYRYRFLYCFSSTCFAIQHLILSVTIPITIQPSNFWPLPLAHSVHVSLAPASQTIEACKPQKMQDTLSGSSGKTVAKLWHSLHRMEPRHAQKPGGRKCLWEDIPASWSSVSNSNVIWLSVMLSHIC